MENDPRRALHAIHPYPCKFPPAAAQEHLDDGGVVLDPFCGSGTTLLEAACRGSAVIGFDCNPIAILLSRVKLLSCDDEFLRDAKDTLSELSDRRQTIVHGHWDLPQFPGRDHWFNETSRVELGGLRNYIDRYARGGDLWSWLAASLSAIVNRFSNQDSETRYVAREKRFSSGQIFDEFLVRAQTTLEALIERGPLPHSKHRVETVDVMRRIPLRDDSIDLVVTSPPYANTMDYYLYHKQRMNVLGFSYKQAQRAEIGSRWEFSSLKASAAKWQDDYNFVIAEIGRVLKPSGRAVIIIGDSQIAGYLVSGWIATSEAANNCGMVATLRDSMPMSGRSRSFSSGFQRPNKYEHVIELQHG